VNCLGGTFISVTQTGHTVTAVLSVAGSYSGSSQGNTAILSLGSDIFEIWRDASTNTLWLWNSTDGVSGFSKQQSARWKTRRHGAHQPVYCI
jgi:hypothetical protein